MRKLYFMLLHLKYGGIEIATINLANLLINDFEIEFIVLYNFEDDLKSLIDKRIKIRYLSKFLPIRKELYVYLKSFKFLRLIKAISINLKVLKDKKSLFKLYIKNIDNSIVISTRKELSKQLSEINNNTITKIAWEHEYHNYSKKYFSYINNYHEINYLVLLSETVVEDYLSYLPRKTKIAIIENYLPYIKHEEIKRSNILVAACRLDRIKGIERLLRIVKDLATDYKLEIIGTGKEKDKLEKLVGSYNLSDRVFFLGELSNKEVIKRIASSTIYTLTSYSEAQPLVIIEANMVGTPSISFKLPMISDKLIEDGVNGYLVNTEKEYLDKLEILLTNKQLCNQMSINARDKYNDFSKDIIKEKWGELLNNKDCD